MSLKLYELVGADAGRPFSPFCWRTRRAAVRMQNSSASAEVASRFRSWSRLTGAATR